MSKTLVGLYSGTQTAARVTDDLVAIGCDRDDVGHLIPEYGAAAPDTGRGAAPGRGDVHGLGRVHATGPLARMGGSDASRPAGGLVDGLEKWGVSRDDAHAYAEGVRRGDSLVLVHTRDDLADRAAEVMARHNPVDVHGRATRWRQSGWTGLAAGARPYSDEERGRYAKEDSIPVVKEDVSVGKRAVEHGGVHLRSYVVERPVEEHVSLRQEHVEVERHKVDRPVQAGDRAFQEREVDATETHEEPVVSKQARVVEEVNLRKDAKKEDRVIQEKARETKVDVDKTPRTSPDRDRPGRHR